MSVKAITSFIILIILSYSTFSQSSRISVLLSDWKKVQNLKKHTEDTATVKLLNTIAAGYYQNFPDSAIYFGKLAFEMARRQNYPKGQVRAVTQLAKANYVKGAYNLSLKASIQGLTISKKNNDIQGKAMSINGIGLIYLAQDKMLSALEQFKAAAALNERLKDTLNLTANYVNIGICYDELHQPEKAILPLNKSIILSSKINNLSLAAMAKNRMGEVHHRIGNFNKAINYHYAVINNKNYQEDWENSFAYSGLANSYYQKGDYNKAIENGKEGLRLAQKVKANWEIERSLKILFKSYAMVKNFKLAYKYLELNKIYSDSLFNESKENEINNLNLNQQQTENRDLIKRNQISQQKIKINRMVIMITALISLSLLVIISLTYKNYLNKNKLNKDLQIKSENITLQHDLIVAQNVELSKLNNTKDQLFSVIGHDLRNPFASIIQTMQLIKDDQLSKEEMAFIMDKLFEKVNVTASMLDNLLLWANSQQTGIMAHLSTFNLPDLIHQLLPLLNLIAIEKKISILHNHPGDALIFADIDHVRIIFQNIISNAIKFTPENGIIEIFYKITDLKVIIHVKDTGVGISNQKLEQLFNLTGQNISTYGTHNEKGIGIGLMLVKKFADENNAGLKILSEEGKGTEFLISFKKPLNDRYKVALSDVNYNVLEGN